MILLHFHKNILSGPNKSTLRTTDVVIFLIHPEIAFSVGVKAQVL